MKHASISCLTAPVLVVLMSSPGYAAKTVLNSTANAMITAPDTSESRLLMKFEMPTVAKGNDIYHAELTFRIPNLGTMTEFELYEVTQAWTPATVGWSESWDKAGGDMSAERIGYWLSDHRTGDLVKFIITDSAKEMRKGTTANHGYIVVTAGEEPEVIGTPSASPTMTIYSGPELHK